MSFVSDLDARIAEIENAMASMTEVLEGLRMSVSAVTDSVQALKTTAEDSAKDVVSDSAHALETVKVMSDHNVIVQNKAEDDPALSLPLFLNRPPSP